MVGYAFYLLEGIGCLMPILREAKHPENFAFLTFSAQWTICIIQIVFSTICYYAWASDIIEPIITELLPSTNVVVQIMKFMFCVNLLFSSKITIVPAFSCLEYFILGVKETNKDENDDNELEDLDEP